MVAVVVVVMVAVVMVAVVVVVVVVVSRDGSSDCRKLPSVWWRD
jgi:preprotein translocase subunit SecG